MSHGRSLIATIIGCVLAFGIGGYAILGRSQVSSPPQDYVATPYHNEYGSFLELKIEELCERFDVLEQQVAGLEVQLSRYDSFRVAVHEEQSSREEDTLTPIGVEEPYLQESLTTEQVKAIEDIARAKARSEIAIDHLVRSRNLPIEAAEDIMRDVGHFDKYLGFSPRGENQLALALADHWNDYFLGKDAVVTMNNLLGEGRHTEFRRSHFAFRQSRATWMSTFFSRDDIVQSGMYTPQQLAGIDYVYGEHFNTVQDGWNKEADTSIEQGFWFNFSPYTNQ
jgi:hypothetical protein